MQKGRIIITAKDIQVITGKSQSTAYTELKTVRDALGKEGHQYLTIKEYCQYCGLDEQEVRAKLKD